MSNCIQYKTKILVQKEFLSNKLKCYGWPWASIPKTTNAVASPRADTRVPTIPYPRGDVA